jgi:hypothetical protein
MAQLIDWHTICWLPEHRSKEDAEKGPPASVAELDHVAG